MGQSEELDIALIREARRGAGDDVDILIDAGQPWDWKTALKRAQQFAEFHPFWLEEPLKPEDVTGYARLTAESPIPIAGGEAESLYADFERLLVEGGVDYLQPDPARCGISTMVAVGRLAVHRGARAVNHTFKSGITIAASLHAVASYPNVDVFEFSMADSPLRHELTNEVFEVVDGYVNVPETPGLGLSINNSTLQKYIAS